MKYRLFTYQISYETFVFLQGAQMFLQIISFPSKQINIFIVHVCFGGQEKGDMTSKQGDLANLVRRVAQDMMVF